MLLLLGHLQQHCPRLLPMKRVVPLGELLVHVAACLLRPLGKKRRCRKRCELRRERCARGLPRADGMDRHDVRCSSSTRKGGRGG